MIDYIDMHQPGFWVAVGFALLAAEVLLFGFTTIILFFAGIGALVTGLAMMSGVLPETWTAGIACFGIATGAAGAVLWKPLKKLQDHGEPKRLRIRPEAGCHGVGARAASLFRRRLESGTGG